MSNTSYISMDSCVGVGPFRTMQGVASETATESVLARLVGGDCKWCDGGTLVRRQFKGDAAVVCETCDTPAARVW